MRTAAGVLGVVTAAVALGAAGAQGTKSVRRVAYTAGAGVTYGNLSGKDFAGTKAAAGFYANAGVVLRRWQLGLGYSRTNHGRTDTNGNYIVSDAYVEPRFSFRPADSRWSPYAAVRAGRAMASYQGVLGITEKATGYIAGVGAGLTWRFAPFVGVDAAVHYARLSHDYGTGGYSPAEKGGRASLRVGVRLVTRR